MPPRRLSPLPAALFGAILVALLASPARTQQWSRFRGPNGSGLGELPAPLSVPWDEKQVRFKVKLPGPGHSSPVLWDDRLFLTCGDETTGARLAICCDADTGRTLWQRRFDAKKHGKHDLNTFASATPAADEKRLYLTWATPEQYVVTALDHDGATLWSEDLGPYKTGHGFGVSPIVHDGLLVVPNEQDGQSSLVALDAATGRLKWKVDRKSQTTYATPCVYERKGRRPLFVFTNWNYGITAHDPADGRAVWGLEVFGKDQVETAIGSPIVAGDLVLGSAGWLGREIHVVAVRPRSMSEAGEAREIYRVERGAPLTTTPLCVGDLLFLWSDEGIVTCADARTGQVHYRHRVGGTFYGSPVSAAGQVFCISKDGELIAVTADKDFKELGRIDLGAPTNSTPAVARGRLYIRTTKHLLAVDP
ncbi:MAG: PQQ-binding-like beta-propeller repeat protein [Planctomycetia bacterium]|nr:PQQ-binding-like beta-propeller repeat protein [Planctomycetia bacterium]